MTEEQFNILIQKIDYLSILILLPIAIFLGYKLTLWLYKKIKNN